MSTIERIMDQPVEKQPTHLSPKEPTEPSLDEFENEIKKQLKELDDQRQNGIITPVQFFQAAAGIATDLERRRREAEAKAIEASIDSLTHLPNRKLFMAAYETLCSRMRREGKPLALFIVDLDGLKQTNDTLGHQEGDKRLVEAAEALRSGARREEDHFGRLGGDELGVCLLDTNADAAIAIALKILKTYDALQTPKEGIKTSLSIGIALLGLTETPESLLVAADRAMYEAKALSHAEQELYKAGQLDAQVIRGNIFIYTKGEFSNAIPITP